MATTKSKKAESVEKVELVIPPIDIRHAVIHIVGDSPLIVHKWSEKAKKEILDKQMKKAKKGAHETKDPVRDFIESMYWLDGEPEDKTEEGFYKSIENGARFGFPSVAFKAAAVSAGYRCGVVPNKVQSYAAFHIDDEFVEIKGNPPVMREDMVRVGGISRAADIRYRGMFENWSADISLNYNATAISIEQIANLFNLGGFACGVGEWRAEKGGRFGMFHVE